jgi:type IV pilus assembly protein PilM
MLDILNLKPDAFSLDVSDLSLKIAKLKKKGDFFDLASFGEEKIRSGTVKNGKIKKEDELVEAIKDSLVKVRGEKLKTKNVIASLPEEKAFLEVIQMPRLPKEDLRSAIVYEAENYIPLPVEEVYLDFQVIPPAAGQLDHLDVLLTALPKEIVDSYLTCFEKAGLQTVALEIESLAIARALIKNETTASPVLLIDFGASRTGFVVFSGRSVRFTFSIPVSSQGFSETISRSLGVDLVEAERLKIKYGLAKKIQLKIKEKLEKKVKKGEVFDALVPALTDLVQQIEKYLHYYQTHTSDGSLSASGKGVEKILICGGGAKLKGLPSFLSSQLKIPVEIGNPWVNILPVDTQPKEQALIYEKEESLNYTTVLGLALREIKEK